MNALGFLRRHLQARVLSVALTILIIGFGVLGVWSIRRQSAALLEQNTEASRRLADAIVKSIEAGMLEGRPDIIRVLTRDLHAVKELEQLTIFRADGVQAFTDLTTLEQVQRDASLDPEVVDRIRKMQIPPTRTMSHPLFRRAVETVQVQELFETVYGVPVLTLLRPLRNESRCQKCHGRDHAVRGVVNISTSMAGVDAELRRNRNRQGLVAFLTILGVAAVLSLTMARVVIRPIRDIARAAKQIGDGDFSVRVPVKTEDEIGALATATNRMAIQLQESYTNLEQKVEERTRELHALTRELARSVEEQKALGEVSQAVSSTLDLEIVLTNIITHAVQLSDANGGVIYEYDEGTQMFDLRATHGAEQELIEALRAAPIRLGEGAVGHAATIRATVQVPDIRDERAFVAARARPILARLGYRSLLAVPLLREQQIVGGLVVWRRGLGTFSTGVVDLLQTFATQSTLAIQNARLFREIEEKGRQLEMASKHKSQFLANMSHEFRTPLNAILGYTELILDNIYGEVPEKIRGVLGRLEKSGRHLLGLINDVLDLSKIEAGQLTLSLNDYSMKEVVQAVLTATGPLAAEKKLALKATVPPDVPLGRGDERRITQVLLNLVGNAIKFTEMGEVRVQVTKSDSDFQVSVSDTGPGISEADQSKIFEEFHQVDSSSTRTKGGTGLGLAITKQIIELHGGRIWVESSPGRGSTFWFALPVRVERQTVAT